jgi:hypothetical protein
VARPVVFLEHGLLGQVKDNRLLPYRMGGTKSEARNPKFETIPNDQNSNYPNNGTVVSVLFLLLEYSDLFRISIFGFRIWPMAIQ